MKAVESLPSLFELLKIETHHLTYSADTPIFMLKTTDYERHCMRIDPWFICVRQIGMHSYVRPRVPISQSVT